MAIRCTMAVTAPRAAPMLGPGTTAIGTIAIIGIGASTIVGAGALARGAGFRCVPANTTRLVILAPYGIRL